MCSTFSKPDELALFATIEVSQNLVNINPTHGVPFRTEHSQMNQSLPAHCISVLISLNFDNYLSSSTSDTSSPLVPDFTEPNLGETTLRG